MTLILVMFAVAIGGPSFAVGLLLGRWEARERPQVPPHQALELLTDSIWRGSRP